MAREMLTLVAPLSGVYDFSKGRRNKYAARYAEGTNVVLLDPDVAKDFPDSKAVNEALRALSAIIRRRPKSRRTA